MAKFAKNWVKPIELTTCAKKKIHQAFKENATRSCLVEPTDCA